MANRLRSSSAKVSFFAFQDMITTVTGVLLLVTLLLTLYLNDSPDSSAPSSGALTKQLEEAQAKLEANLAQLGQRQLQEMTLTNRVFVVPEPDRSGKTPVLVVLSATNGWCMRLGRTNAVEFLLRPDNADFRRLLDSWSAAADRLVFYVRPSGIALFETCRQLAAARGFNFGYDAAEEGRQYVLASP